MKPGHERIESIIESNECSVLIPILKDFENEDVLTYQKIATALFRAYRAGILKTEAVVKQAVNQ